MLREEYNLIHQTRMTGDQFMTDYVIDAMNETDWEHVRSIYIEGVSTGDATFETEAPAWERWDASHLPSCRLVARSGGSVKGWAALSPVSGRRVYAGVAEVSVYIGRDYRGQGVGQALLAALIAASEAHGLWTLQASIFPENEASVKLHRRFGFREVGRRERIGRMNGRWRDTALFERRSQVVGLD
jgi:phosphinothricin acetyltransferase